MDCIVRTVLPDWAVPLLAEEVCPTIGGGGSAGPLGIGRVPELEPRATRPRVTQRGEISPLFEEAISRCFARCAPPPRIFVSAQPSASPDEAHWRRGSCWWTPTKLGRCHAGAGGGGRFGGGLGLLIASVSLPLISLIGHAGVRPLGCLAFVPRLPQRCTRSGSALPALAVVRIGL